MAAVGALPATAHSLIMCLLWPLAATLEISFWAPSTDDLFLFFFIHTGPRWRYEHEVVDLDGEDT
ncbi:hypothetical protein FA10DRAFT_73110 [Acaromyces ingoldii]|uniref:Uncharacterized protein n=1 Tax=Acaromyces ingoldii TaxID=215250 RepID=A0A316YQN7_9BASI|nr:hypothetical protein FA10DRAFT_73110 [Acaromyces ingoldii]PWN91697.1 hypothetical protein FA10DRAFT_73110 [Acaromyces ingoldii]